MSDGSETPASSSSSSSTSSGSSRHDSDFVVRLDLLRSVKVVDDGGEDGDDGATMASTSFSASSPNLSELRILGATTKADLATFFAGRADNHDDDDGSRGDSEEAFLVVRNALGNTGVVPLGFGTDANQGSGAARVTWFKNRWSRGSKTTTQVRLSDAKPMAWVVVASDKKRKAFVYAWDSLVSRRHRHALPAPLPRATKSFKWRGVALSRNGDAVAALCEDPVTTGADQAIEPQSLWVWTAASASWTEVAGRWSARHHLAFTEGGALVVLAPAEASRTRGDAQVSTVKLSLSRVPLGASVSAEGGIRREDLSARVDLRWDSPPTTKMEQLEESGRCIATVLSSSEECAVILSDNELGTRGIGRPPRALLEKHGNANVVAIAFVPTLVKAHLCCVTLLAGGLFCVFDGDGSFLSALGMENGLGRRVRFPPSLAQVDLGASQYLVCIVRDQIQIMSVRQGVFTEEEEGSSAGRLGRGSQGAKEASDPKDLYSGLLESLLVRATHGKTFETLLDDLEGTLVRLTTDLGASVVLPCLETMIVLLCEEEDYEAALWLLETSEGLLSGEREWWPRALTHLDWLNLWQILANSVFESLDQGGGENRAIDYHEIASALWKRLASGGFDSIVASQFTSASDAVFSGEGTEKEVLAGKILDADRAFVHGEVERGLDLYKEAGVEGLMSYIACCVHGQKMEECFEATYDLLCLGVETSSISEVHLGMVKEVCSELGSLLLDVHRPNEALDESRTFPSPLSWSTSHGSSISTSKDSKARRIPLDLNGLRYSLHGLDSNPSLALGIFVHSLDHTNVSLLLDASLIWDDLGQWRHTVCFLTACQNVFESYGKNEAAEHIGGQVMGYLQSKLEKKLLGHGFLDTLSLAEIVSLLRIFLLQSESPTKSRLFADMMSMLQNSLREEVAQMLLVSDLSAVKGLAERCSHLYQVLGAVCSVLVSVSRSFYDLQDVSYDAEGRVRVLGTSNADECYSETLSSVCENLFQVFMTVRSYALLAAQWRSWQSSSNAKERNEKMTDVILCLARILLSDSSVQKSQNAQKTVCWILEDFTPAEVIEDDPALLIMLETSIQKGQMTGPTRKLIERLVGKIDLDRESQGHAETARAYLDALKSDSAYCLQELFRQCSEAIGWTEGNIHEKEFEDEGLGTIHLLLLEPFPSCQAILTERMLTITNGHR